MRHHCCTDCQNRLTLVPFLYDCPPSSTRWHKGTCFVTKLFNAIVVKGQTECSVWRISTPSNIPLSIKLATQMWLRWFHVIFRLVPWRDRPSVRPVLCPACLSRIWWTVAVTTATMAVRGDSWTTHSNTSRTMEVCTLTNSPFKVVLGSGKIITGNGHRLGQW